MGFISNLSIFAKYYKYFKGNVIVRLAGEDACNYYAFACCYRAQESVAQYYCAFNPQLSLDDAMELIFYSKALRETIKKVIFDVIFQAKEHEFNFDQNADDLQFFQECKDLNTQLCIAKLFSRKHGMMLMLLLSFRTEQAFYAYLRRKTGYNKSWKEFMDQLMAEQDFFELCFAGFKYWLVNISFPEIIWSNKSVVGLMDDALKRKNAIDPAPLK